MGQAVGHVDRLPFLQKIHHVERGRAGVDVDKIFARHETGCAAGNGDFFFRALTVLGRHVLFHGCVVVVDGRGPAVDLVEQPSFVELGEVAADGGF